MGLFGGGSQKVETKTEPWGAQQPYLKRGFDVAGDILDQRQAAGPYGGSGYAGTNGALNLGLNQGLTTGTAGVTTGLDLLSQSAGALGRTGNFDKTALDAADFLAGDNTGRIRSAANQFGNPNITKALNDFQTDAKWNADATDNFGTVAQRANSSLAKDQTGAITDNLGRYINNDILQGQIDAVTRDIDRSTFEQALPQMNMEASQGGNTNSSRAGVAEGIIRRGRNDAVADAAAGIRGNAYNGALSAALQDQQMTNQGIINGSQLVSGANSQATQQGLATQGAKSQEHWNGINAGMGATELNNSGVQAGANINFQANQQAVQNALAGQDMAGRGSGMTTGVGNNIAQLNQGALNEAQRQYALKNGGYAQGALNDYWGIVGGQNFGSSGTQSGGGGVTGSQLLGAGATILGGFLSDIRVKEGIHMVGVTKGGLPVYRFRYTGTPDEHIGVMAQEALELQPEAVLQGPGGFLMVDYSKVH